VPYPPFEWQCTAYSRAAYNDANKASRPGKDPHSFVLLCPTLATATIECVGFPYTISKCLR
jgi:hypothetical protein